MIAYWSRILDWAVGYLEILIHIDVGLNAQRAHCRFGESSLDKYGNEDDDGRAAHDNVAVSVVVREEIR